MYKIRLALRCAHLHHPHVDGMSEARAGVHPAQKREDKDVWILRDPLGDGSRDRLVMHVLRIHKN